MSSVLVSADKDTGVAVVTLDRPDRLNAIDLAMADELASAWRELRFDDTVRAIVLTGAGERAFCTGIDRDAVVPQPNSPYTQDDPLLAIGPKANDLWKPVVAAVRRHGLRWRLLPPGRVRVPRRGPDRHLLRPAHHLRHGQRLRVGADGTASCRTGRPRGWRSWGRRNGSRPRRAYEVGLVTELTERGRALGGGDLVPRRSSPGIRPRPCRERSARCGPRGRPRARTGVAQAPHLVALGNAAGERQADLFRERSREFRLRRRM